MMTFEYHLSVSCCGE